MMDAGLLLGLVAACLAYHGGVPTWLRAADGARGDLEGTSPGCRRMEV